MAIDKDKSGEHLRDALRFAVLVLTVMAIIIFVSVFPELRDYLESWLKQHTE